EKCRLDERLLTDAAGAGDPLSAVFEMLGHTLEDRRTYRVFFELLPVVLRDEQLLRRQVAFDRWLLDGLSTVLAGGAPAVAAERSDALAVVLLAAADGLALQTLLDPRGFDPAPSLAVFRSLLMEWARADGQSRRARC
ncbi:MAG: TetR family transcriptional regulator C-terminal domain-containing protein, partial [Actinobacteria bacterium]|nr:TetR family transcriptional regulator C-terminal domain-containing protein [Actinomycetota bacterium]